MAPGSLTAAERETIITMNDEDGTAEIWTAQRPIITKLKANPLAVLVEEGHYGRTTWARFELPKGKVSFRATNQKGRERVMSAEERAATAERLARGRASKQAI